mmetsp:Transcript_10598/g.17548  ORF Transcript_10598/g.17548 Transcript_10598/m.17548 type:complete len:478 (+) Transcript_10598:639-2072(+)
MFGTIFGLEHHSHCWGIIERRSHFNQQQELGLSSNSNGTATSIVLVKQTLSALLLDSKVFDLVNRNTEMMQRSFGSLFADVAKENRDSSLCAYILLLHTNLEQCILEQNTRCGGAKIRECLPHSRNNFLWNANSGSRIPVTWRAHKRFRLLLLLFDGVVRVKSSWCIKFFSFVTRAVFLSRGSIFRCTSSCDTLSGPLPLSRAWSSGLENCGTVISLLLFESLFKSTLSSIFKRRHLAEQVFNGFGAESLAHGRVFRSTLLDLNINTVLASSEYRRHKRTALFVQVCKLGISRDKNGSSLLVRSSPVLMQDSELLFATHPWTLGDQKTKLSKNVSSNTHSSLVTTSWTGTNQQSCGCVGLKVALWMICDNLNHSMPNCVTNVITTDRNQLQNSVHVPTKVGGVLLGKDSNLQHHLFADRCIGKNQMGHKLIDNAFCVISVAHNKEKVEGTTSNTNIGILQRYEHCGLVLLDTLGTAV